MKNHYYSVGFPVDDREDQDELAALAAKNGQPVQVGDGYYIRFALSPGPELWVQANAKRQLVGCHPHFSGASTVRASVDKVLGNPHSPFDGSLRVTAMDAGGTNFPFQCDIPDFAAVAARLAPGIQVVLQVAAFAETVQCFADENAFRSSCPPADGLATQAVIPSGLFTPEGESTSNPRSVVILTGRIKTTELRSNPLTGIQFHYLLVESLGGSFDVVADPKTINGTAPVVGGIVLGTFWLSARLSSGPK